MIQVNIVVTNNRPGYIERDNHMIEEQSFNKQGWT